MKRIVLLLLTYVAIPELGAASKGPNEANTLFDTALNAYVADSSPDKAQALLDAYKEASSYTKSQTWINNRLNSKGVRIDQIQSTVPAQEEPVAIEIPAPEPLPVRPEEPAPVQNNEPPVAPEPAPVVTPEPEPVEVIKEEPAPNRGGGLADLGDVSADEARQARETTLRAQKFAQKDTALSRELKALFTQYKNLKDDIGALTRIKPTLEQLEEVTRRYNDLMKLAGPYSAKIDEANMPKATKAYKGILYTLEVSHKGLTDLTNLAQEEINRNLALTKDLDQTIVLFKQYVKNYQYLKDAQITSTQDIATIKEQFETLKQLYADLQKFDQDIGKSSILLSGNSAHDRQDAYAQARTPFAQLTKNSGNHLTQLEAKINKKVEAFNKAQPVPQPDLSPADVKGLLGDLDDILQEVFDWENQVRAVDARNAPVLQENFMKWARDLAPDLERYPAYIDRIPKGLSRSEAESRYRAIVKRSQEIVKTLETIIGPMAIA